MPVEPVNKVIQVISPSSLKPFMTRSRACEIIIKYLKTEAVQNNEDLSNALKLAWHALLRPAGTER